LVQEAGIHPMLHRAFAAPLMDGNRVGGIISESKAGREAILARRVIDATDLVVAPGFIDLHTHYDAQAFWDGTLSPSPLHGVTTVMAGNCGFSIAPITPEAADYLIPMLARVEGMPVETLEAGLDRAWDGFGSWLDRLEGNLAVNAGFLVGHSALRRVVMGEAAVGEQASPAQLAAMVALLHESIAAGGMGFSSTASPSHSDHDGDPVPSRFATAEEFIALLKMVDRGVPRSKLVGSWAGAFGNPQFLPSVYLRVAQDGDGDGFADIWASRQDTLASIANYFRDAGWRPGETWGFAVTTPAGLDRAALGTSLASPRCPQVYARHSRWRTMREWRALGMIPKSGSWPEDAMMASLIEPDGPGHTAYLLTGNYRVILDYNCSNLYALSVGLLADEIAR
jgi:hypothetical protein